MYGTIHGGIQDSMMCADNKGQGKKDACAGDSGGKELGVVPLTRPQLSGAQLLGIFHKFLSQQEY